MTTTPDGLAASIARVLAYTEARKLAKVDDISKNGHIYQVPAPDRISGGSDGSQLLLSDLIAILNAAPPSGLTDAQRDGLACIRCGREDTAMVPTGHSELAQMFRCADDCTKQTPAGDL